MSRRAFSLCLAFLLLFAQYAAVAHAISHTHGGGSQQRALDCQDRCFAEQPTESDPAKLCAFDIAFCQVLGTAAGSSQALRIDPVLANAAYPHDLIVPPARLIAPLSRGPPQLF
jgi:hypothetical protein